MQKMLRTTRSSARLGLAGTLLAMLLILGLDARPAAAGAGASCCICSVCIPGPVSICVEGGQGSCETTCNVLSCFSSETAAGSCSSQQECSQFVPPAAAPALAPYGLGLAAVVLAGLGLRGMRRRS